MTEFEGTWPDSKLYNIVKIDDNDFKTVIHTHPLHTPTGTASFDIIRFMTEFEWRDVARWFLEATAGRALNAFRPHSHRNAEWPLKIGTISDFSTLGCYSNYLLPLFIYPFSTLNYILPKKSPFKWLSIIEDNRIKVLNIPPMCVALLNLTIPTHSSDIPLASRIPESLKLVNLIGTDRSEFKPNIIRLFKAHLDSGKLNPPKIHFYYSSPLLGPIPAFRFQYFGENEETEAFKSFYFLDIDVKKKESSWFCKTELMKDQNDFIQIENDSNQIFSVKNFPFKS